MQQPAIAMGQQEGDTTRGNATTGQRNKRTRGWLGISALCNSGTRFDNTPIFKHKGREIKAGGGGVNTAISWVQFDIARAHDDGGGDTNHAMLTQKVFVDVTNCKDAALQAEHNLVKKRRAKLFCFVSRIEKNHDRMLLQSRRLGGEGKAIFVCLHNQEKSQRNAPAIHKTWGSSLVVCSLPPECDTLLWEMPFLLPGSFGCSLNATPPLGRLISPWRRRRTARTSQSTGTLAKLAKGAKDVVGGVNAADGGGDADREGVSTKYLNQIQYGLLEGVRFQGQLHVQASAVTVN
jgi:hypothetical protein